MEKQEKTTIIVLKGKISAESFDQIKQKKEEIKKSGHLHLIISSPGGETPKAGKIWNELRAHKESGIKITTHGEGLIGSSALPIYLEGEYRTLDSTASIKIDLPHKLHPKGIILGYEGTGVILKRLTEENEALIKVRLEWAKIIAYHVKMSVEEIYRSDDTGETIVPARAKSLGFCHEIIAEQKFSFQSWLWSFFKKYFKSYKMAAS